MTCASLAHPPFKPPLTSCRRSEQMMQTGGDELEAVKSYFDTTGFERWNKIYGETDEVNKVSCARAPDACTRCHIATGRFGWPQVQPATPHSIQASEHTASCSRPAPSSVAGASWVVLTACRRSSWTFARAMPRLWTRCCAGWTRVRLGKLNPFLPVCCGCATHPAPCC